MVTRQVQKGLYIYPDMETINASSSIPVMVYERMIQFAAVQASHDATVMTTCN